MEDASSEIPLAAPSVHDVDIYAGAGTTQAKCYLAEHFPPSFMDLVPRFKGSEAIEI